MATGTDQLLTIGDLVRDSQLKGYTRRQLEYAIQEARIEPMGRLGIIRAFGTNQIPLILSAVRRTARTGGAR